MLDYNILRRGKDECTSNVDCFTDKVIDSVCCKDSRDSIRRCTLYNCRGYYCATDGDCSRSECCINNVCTDSYRCLQCDSKNHCASDEFLF